MHYTVVICTWNRSDLLRQTLERFTELQAPDEATWDVLVVNNGSTDDTSEVVSSFASSLPIREVAEPKAGLSNARNAAIDHVECDYMIWTDDDVLIDENWLRAYDESFRQHPEAAVFGGPIEPWFEGDPPTWLSETWPLVSDAYAIRSFGDEPLQLTRKVVPFGANYAIRTAEQRENRYDPALGKARSEQRVGEELAVIRAILLDGGTGWWVPDAKVQHFIPASRQSLAYLKRWFIDLGQTSAWMARRNGTFTSRDMLRRLMKFLVTRSRLVVRRRFGEPAEWMEDFRTAYICLGYLQRPAGGMRGRA